MIQVHYIENAQLIRVNVNNAWAHYKKSKALNTLTIPLEDDEDTSDEWKKEVVEC